MPDMELRRLPPQATVAVRVAMPMAEVDMAALFDRDLPRVAQRLRRRS